MTTDEARGRPSGGSGGAAGGASSDSHDKVVWVVRFELRNRPETADAAAGIAVDVRDGVVTLSGDVSSREVAATAGAVSLSVPGVRAVVNQLMIDGRPLAETPVSPEAEHARLKRRLLPWLLWSQVLAAPLAGLWPGAVSPASAALLGMAVARNAPPAQRARGLLGLRRPRSGWLRGTLLLLLPILTWSRLVAMPLVFFAPGEIPDQLPGTFLTLVVFAPFFEEILFRGLLLELWRPKGKLVAMFFTALLFGLGHGLWLLPSTMLMGWFLAWLTWEYDSVWPAFVVHGANNLFSTLLGQHIAAAPDSWALGMLATGVMISAGLVLSLAARVELRRALRGPWVELPPGTRGKTLATELWAAFRLWPVAVAVALCLVSMALSVVALRL